MRENDNRFRSAKVNHALSWDIAFPYVEPILLDADLQLEDYRLRKCLFPAGVCDVIGAEVRRYYVTGHVTWSLVVSQNRACLCI